MVDLLDYDVRFGQGFLFSPPRPVRAEALQGVADRGDVIVRDDRHRGRRAGAGPLRAFAASRAANGAGNGPRTTGLAQLARSATGRI